jgi:subtilisin
MRCLVNLSLVVLSALLFSSCQNNTESLEPADDCLVRAAANNGQIIPEEYIITYRTPGLSSRTGRQGTEALGQALAQWDIAASAVESVVAGEQTLLVAHLEADELGRIRADPSVERVEPDRVVSLCSCVDVVAPRTLSWSVRKTGYGRTGLVSQKVAWIVDTGIDLDHPDLNVDNTLSRSFVTGQTSADDQNGHGTHVAGIIGARNNQVGLIGIASDIKLVALKVLNQLGEGRLSAVISAVRHISANGKAGDVVNISLGGEGISPTLDREIQAAANLGILFAIAAGNEREDANNYSPARTNHPNVFTVSAVDSLDRFASFSNFGPSVDVAAYGVRVLSTYNNGRYAVLSGTSMAAPHVAGLLLTRGANIPRRGTALNDPDGRPDPIARE